MICSKKNDQRERCYLTCSNTLTKNLLNWVPQDSIDTGNKFVKNNCSVSVSLDLTNDFSPNDIKTLSMGPKFIPKDNNTGNEKLHKNVETWGEEIFIYLTVKTYRKDELTHIRSKNNITRRKLLLSRKQIKATVWSL